MKQKIKNSLAVFSLLLLGCLYIWHFGASLHEVCPGAAVCAGALCLKNGEVFFTGGLIFFAGIVITSIFFNRFFCGWLCPVGLFQRVLFSLRVKLFKKRISYPHRLHQLLVVFKYMLTALIVFSIFYTGKMLTVDYCPVYLAAGWGTLDLPAEALVVTGILIAGTLLIRRFFCRYLCPLSVFFEIKLLLAHKLKITKTIERNTDHCTNCKICEIHCPAGIKILHKRSCNTAFCLACRECIKRCPQNKKGKKTLYFK